MAEVVWLKTLPERAREDAARRSGKKINDWISGCILRAIEDYEHSEALRDHPLKGPEDE